MSRLAEKEKSLSEKDQILSGKDKLLSAALTEISSLKDQLRLANRSRYGSKSQKGKCVRNKADDSHEKNKNDFDGTAGSLPACQLMI